MNLFRSKNEYTKESHNENSNNPGKKSPKRPVGNTLRKLSKEQPEESLESGYLHDNDPKFRQENNLQPLSSPCISHSTEPTDLHEEHPSGSINSKILKLYPFKYVSGFKPSKPSPYKPSHEQMLEWFGLRPPNLSNTSDNLSESQKDVLCLWESVVKLKSNENNEEGIKVGKFHN